MEGRVVLVTGASAGIGAAICRALLKRGATVIGIARKVEQIRAIGQEEDILNATGKLVAWKCDLTNEAEILTVFDEIRSSFGRLDVCINNAGLCHNSPLLSSTTADWRNMIDVNVMALCICTREAVKLMREKNIDDGHIIHIGSTAGHHIPDGLPSFHFYSGTKFMVRILTEGLRRELKALNSNIRVGSVSPGIVETEFLTCFFKDKDKADQFYNSMESLKPEDVAETVLYILSQPPHVEVHDVLMRPTQQKN